MTRMGKTITEKILTKAAGRGQVSPGDDIEVGSRCPTPMGNAGSLRGGVEFCAEWKVGVSGGIWVIASSGEVIGILRIPALVRNLAFGGPDFRTLYLTPRGSLSKLQVKTPGIGAFS